MLDSENNACRILIIGGLLVDDIAIAAENLIPGSSNPVRWHHNLGGVATNVARVAAQQLNVLLIASTGDDDQGKLATKLLAQQEISSSLIVCSGQSTDRYSAVLQPNGDLFVGLADARLVEQMRWSDIEQRLPDWRPDAIVIDANLSGECLAQTVSTLADKYAPAVPLYGLTVSPAKSRRWLSVATQVDTLLCNRNEAAALTEIDPHSTLDALANGLVEKGFNRFVITDGGETILVQEYQTRSYVDVPAIQVEKNVNGAGDAMAGATIVQLVLGQALPQAIQAAGLAAARAVLSGDSESPSI